MRKQTQWTISLALVGLFGLLTNAPTWAQPPSWGGDGCTPQGDLRGIVDNAFVTAPFGSGRGSSAPGYSVALLHDDCGLFAYAVGDRRLAPRAPNLPKTRQHIGSLSKPVTTALTLILADQGLFGPLGIDTRLTALWPKRELKRLARGGDGERLCPVTAAIIDRNSLAQITQRVQCPKFKKVTLRHLLNGNHGMHDFLNEHDRNENGLGDLVEYTLGEFLRSAGLDPLQAPEDSASAMGVIEAMGLLKADQARIGGRRPQDFELSFGNTGYQLLGLLLERLTGQTYDELVELHITQPLGVDQITLVTEVPRRLGNLASEYATTTGAVESGLQGADENLLGAYPLVDINGHAAADVFDLGPVAFTNGAGGAGGLSASPSSYVQFFHALIQGRLLSPAAQTVLNGGYIEVEGTGFDHGFALFRFTSSVSGLSFNKGGATIGSQCEARHVGPEGDAVTGVVCRNSADLFLPNPTAGLVSASTSVSALVLSLAEAAR